MSGAILNDAAGLKLKGCSVADENLYKIQSYLTKVLLYVLISPSLYLISNVHLHPLVLCPDGNLVSVQVLFL